MKTQFIHTVDLAEAKARLRELIELAANGHTVRILRYGKPVAQITAIPGARKPIGLEELRALTRAMPRQRKSARTIVRKMRDESRY